MMGGWSTGPTSLLRIGTEGMAFARGGIDTSGGEGGGPTALRVPEGGTNPGLPGVM